MAGTSYPLHDHPGWSVSEHSGDRVTVPVPGETLFLSMDYIRQKNYSGLLIFDLMDSQGSTRVRVPFSESNEGIVSLPGVPYGGPSVSHPPPPQEVMTAFWRFCAELINSPAILKLGPAALLPDHALLTASLSDAGAVLSDDMINYHIRADHYDKSHLHRMQRRRYRKGVEAGLIFRQEPVSFLPEAYDLIQTYRTARGHSMPVGLDELEASFRNFPGHYYLFSVSLAGERLALLVAVQVTDEVLYYFLPANKPGAEALSPSVFMIYHLVEWAAARGLKFVDLGPSLHSDRSHNEPLATFKKRMGGITSFRQTFRL